MTVRWNSHAELRALFLVAFALLGHSLGCAGRTNAERDSSAAGAGTVAEGGAGGAMVGPTGSNFVPDVSPAYDEKNALSFENNLGFGWDGCRTRTLENV